MVGSKRKNRAWITLDLLETCRVSQTTWPIMSGGSTRRPVWKLVLSYELEVWKRAYNNLRNGKLDSLRKALELARAEIINKIINRHFLVPLTASTEFLSTPAGFDGWPSSGYPFLPPPSFHGKGGRGKGKCKGRGTALSMAGYQIKTENQVGRWQEAMLSFRFNDGSCQDKGCPFHHASKDMARSLILIRPNLWLEGCF